MEGGVAHSKVVPHSQTKALPTRPHPEIVRPADDRMVSGVEIPHRQTHQILPGKSSIRVSLNAEKARSRGVLTCSQIEDFETAVADMHSGATVKPVLIY